MIGKIGEIRARARGHSVLLSRIVPKSPRYAPDCIGISYYLIPAIANKRRINALSVRLVGFISSHQLTDRKPLVWPLSVVFRCLPTDRIYFCLDNRVLCVGITLLFAPSASRSHSPDRRSYRQCWTRSRLGSSLKRVFVGFCDYPHK